jgi:hypothetical protein
VIAWVFKSVIADPVSQVKEHNPNNILCLGAIANALNHEMTERSPFPISIKNAIALPNLN